MKTWVVKIRVQSRNRAIAGVACAESGEQAQELVKEAFAKNMKEQHGVARLDSYWLTAVYEVSELQEPTMLMLDYEYIHSPFRSGLGI